jgi:hypothetical protein
METNTQPAAQAATPEGQKTETPAAQQTAATKKFADRYDSVEAMEKGYKELQALSTKQAQELSSLKKTPETTAQPQAQTTKTEMPAPEAKTETQLFPALIAEFQANNGKLSDKTVEIAAKQLGMNTAQAKKLESFLKQEVDSGLAQLQAVLDKEQLGLKVNDVLAEAGKHYDPAQLAKIQEALDAGFTGVFADVARTVAKGRKAGTPGQVGSVASEAVGGGFASADEINKATADPRFGIDGIYTRQVEARHKATSQGVLAQWESFGKKNR